jgi:HD-like signal output (HDOD) protein/CheY-like chemotaxis protein
VNKRILFVDDDADLLNGLRRALRKQREYWDMSFVQSPQEALALTARIAPDAVVADMRMPQINGIELLSRIEQQHPTAIRMILTGHADRELAARAVGIVHQQMSKPCDTATLVDALQRALALRDMLSDENLRALVSTTQCLPSLPHIYQELRTMLHSEDTTLPQLADLIAEDPPMTAKLLQLVNSAFFGPGRRIASPREALAMIGIDTLQSLVLNAGIYSQFIAGLPQTELELLDTLWQRSVGVGTLARQIGAAEGLSGQELDSCFTGGLLHDIGQLILTFNLPEQWREIEQLAQSRHMSFKEAENTVINTDHSILGAYLLGLWALPVDIVEAVAYQDRPVQSPHGSFCALTAVHVAKALYKADGDHLDSPYLESLGLGDRLPAWREIANYQARETGALS